MTSCTQRESKRGLWLFLNSTNDSKLIHDEALILKYEPTDYMRLFAYMRLYLFEPTVYSSPGPTFIRPF